MTSIKQIPKIIYPLAMDNWDGEELEAIQQVIVSNRFSMGYQVAEFEREIALKFGSKHAVMVNSGSSANLLMLTTIRILLSGKFTNTANIIVPAVSWSTTYTPAFYLGYKLKFVDVDTNHFGLTAEKVREAVDENTVAILTVNLLGSASDLFELKALAEELGIFLLEDNCESLGASLGEKFTGTFGHMGSHSSFFSHHINTMEGGWVTTDDSDTYEILISLRAHGWSRGLPVNSKLRTNEKQDWFSSQFEFVLPGMNVRPLEMEAAIGRVQLAKVDVMLQQRRQNAEFFLKAMEATPRVRAQKPIGESSWFAFAMIFESPKMRKLVAEKLKTNGIECRPIVTGNFTRQPVLKYLQHEIHGDLAIADNLHFSGLYIGNHPSPLKKEISQTISLVADLVEKMH